MNIEERIQKLSALTEARGATKAEAATAQAKIAEIRERIRKEREAKAAEIHKLFHQAPKYVEGWPGQKPCEHRRYSLHNRTGMAVCHDCHMAFIPSAPLRWCGHDRQLRTKVQGRWFCTTCGGEQPHDSTAV